MAAINNFLEIFIALHNEETCFLISTPLAVFVLGAGLGDSRQVPELLTVLDCPRLGFMV